MSVFSCELNKMLMATAGRHQMPGMQPFSCRSDWLEWGNSKKQTPNK